MTNELRRRGGEQLAGRRQLGDVSRRLHHGDSRSEDDRLVDVVGDEHHGLAHLLLEPAELTLQLGANDRIDGAERLVHQQDGWVGCQGAGDADALLLATGQLGRILRRQRAVEPDDLEQLGGAGVATPLVPAEQARHGGHVVDHRTVREQPALLDHVADAAAQLVTGHRQHVAPGDADRARRRLDEAVDHPQRRRLATTGAAQEDDDLALIDGERQVVDGQHAAEALGDVIDLDHRTAPPALIGGGRMSRSSTRRRDRGGTGSGRCNRW